MKLLIIDNYDSFTYNLAQAFAKLGARVDVVRNDRVDLDAIAARAPQFLVISAGPGGPGGTGICAAAVERYRGLIPVLGVCLGHQLLAEVFGGRVVRGDPVHGKRSWVEHEGVGIFGDLPTPFIAARYHSLVVAPEALPPSLRRAAWTERGEIMGIGVPGEATWGVQFHPESFMTPDGDRLLRAFLAGTPCPEDDHGSGCDGASGQSSGQ